MKREHAGLVREAQRLFGVGSVGAMSDERLLEQFLSRRSDVAEPAFEALVRRHGPMVLTVCRNVLDDPHAAQDAFQATFLVLVRKAHGIGRSELLGNWLYGVALRTALKARAGAARRIRHERRVSEMVPEAIHEDPDRKELAGVLHEEMSRLPRKYRAPVVLCYLEGMSYASAARQLCVTEATIRGRLARARDLLRDRLSRRGAMLGLGLLVTEGSRKLPAAVAPGLVRSTVVASMGLATGGSRAIGVIPAGVAILLKGVLRAMLLSRLKVAGWAVAAAGVVAIGIWAGGVSEAQQVAQARTSSRAGARHAPPGNLASPAPPSRRPVSERPNGIDEALARLVEGRIVGTSPIIKDSMVLSYLPDWAHGEVDNLGVSNNDGGVRTLVNWKSLPQQESGSPNRRFVLAFYSRKTTTAGKTGPILAFEVSQDWPELTSWSSQPDYAPEPAATFKFAPGEGWKLFDITQVVRSRAVGDNHGVLLRWLSEDRSGRKKDWSGYQFVSREGTGEWEGRRPLLLIVEPDKR